MWDKLLGVLKGNTIKEIGNVVSDLNVGDDEKSTAKNKLTEIVMNAILQVKQLQSNIITAEIGKGSWLTANWRPMVMMILTFLLVAKWTGLTVDVSEALELELMKIIKIGIGGYIGGRTLEKVADKVTQNIDMPFLKKKDRK